LAAFLAAFFFFAMSFFFALGDDRRVHECAPTIARTNSHHIEIELSTGFNHLLLYCMVENAEIQLWITREYFYEAIN